MPCNENGRIIGSIFLYLQLSEFVKKDTLTSTPGDFFSFYYAFYNYYKIILLPDFFFVNAPRLQLHGHNLHY